MILDYYLPIKTDFYLECLSADNMEAYYRTQTIVEKNAERIGGIMGALYKDSAFPMIDMGLMRPAFEDADEETYHFWFEFWSVVKGEFLHPGYMTRMELTYVNELMTYYSRSN